MKKTIPILPTVLFLISLITAYNGISSPSYYLENEWTRFILIFIVFFAVIFYTINKSFKNKGIAAAIGVSISLLISMAIARRGLLYGYFGDQIGSWLLIIATLILIGFLIKFSHENFGYIGSVITVTIIWFILHSIDPYEVLPYEIITNNFLMIYEFIASWLGGIIIVGITLAVTKTIGKKTPAEKVIKSLFSKN